MIILTENPIHFKALCFRAVFPNALARRAFFLYNLLMKKQKRLVLQCAAVAFFALVCFFFSWSSLDTELHLTPEWTSDINKTPEIQTSEARLPFRLGNKGGYFTHSGKIALLETIPYKATLSRKFFAAYEKDARNIQLKNPDGTLASTIKEAGFPFIQQDRVFLFGPGGSTISFVNPLDGSVISTYENAAPITAFNSSSSGSAAGYADGQFIIFDKNGKKKTELFPGGSDMPIILGADISESGKLFACISGIEPQRFVLYRDEGNYKKIIFHDFLKKNLTRRCCVHFSKNNQYVYYDSADSIDIVNTQSLKRESVPLPGTILSVQESPVAQSVYILSKIGKEFYKITILENWTKKAGDFSFKAQSAFILTDENTLYVGRDNKISKIAISKN